MQRKYRFAGLLVGESISLASVVVLSAYVNGEIMLLAAGGILAGLLYRLYRQAQYVHTLERKVAELDFYAYHDMATGIYNRNALMQRMCEIDDSKKHAAVLLCDIDGLKQINDTLGHAAGDQMIRTAATILKSCLPPQAALYRFGGDEFVVLCEEPLAMRQAIDLKHSIQAAIKHYNQQGTITLRLSIGTAVAEDKACTCNELLQLADAQMYQEKCQRGHVQYIM